MTNDMRGIILRIIFANLGNKLESTPHFTSAREIAEMMSEFIEWTSSEYFDGTRWWIEGQEGMTTDELFTYWKENIKKQ